MGNEINSHSNITLNSHSSKSRSMSEHNTIYSNERPFKNYESI